MSKIINPKIVNSKIVNSKIINLSSKFKRFGYCGYCDHEEFKLPLDIDDNITSITCAKCGYKVPLPTPDSTINQDKQF